METFKLIEVKMEEWQNGIRFLYEDIQTFHNWTEEKAWKELEFELLNNVPGNQFGEDDLAFVRAILVSERDITLWEAVRLMIRFRHSTPLLDALENLRARDNLGT